MKTYLSWSVIILLSFPIFAAFDLFQTLDINSAGDTRSVAVGDIDNDGDFDIVFSSRGGMPVIYRNDISTFTFVSINWQPLVENRNTIAVALGDYNNDGRLDILCGNDGQPSRIYRNDGSDTFTHIWQTPLSTRTFACAWGDYNNDGLLDFVLGNFKAPNHVYRNNGNNTFTLVWSSPESDNTFSVAWGDYDNDGDLDILVGNLEEVNKIYRNDGNNVFSRYDFTTSTQPTHSVAWGDFDNDGDLDILVGNHNAPIRVYRNKGDGTFIEFWASPIEYVQYPTGVAWGDYDNDGDLDILAGGDGYTNKIYRNDISTFTDTPVWQTTETDRTFSVAWADFNNDKKLDFVVANKEDQLNHVYISTITTFNTVPSAPSAFSWSYCISTFVLKLSWSNGDDDKTPPAGLYYNIRIGTRSYKSLGDDNIISGIYGSPLLGNYIKPRSALGENRIFIRNLLTETTYYWSVQTIDTALARSAWSTEQTVYIDVPPPAPTRIAVSDLALDGKLRLSWKNPMVADFSHIRIYRSTDPAFPIIPANIVYDNIKNENIIDSKLVNGVKYFYLIRSVDRSGKESTNIDRIEGIPTGKYLYSFDTGIERWVHDQTVYYRNNLGPPSHSTSISFEGAGSLSYSLDLDDKVNNAYINDIGYVRPVVPLALVDNGYWGIKLYIFVSTRPSANIPSDTPLCASVYVKTGPNWKWFEGDMINLGLNQWTEITLYFKDARYYEGGTEHRSPVTDLDDIKEVGFHISGGRKATGIATIYVDAVVVCGYNADPPPEPKDISVTDLGTGKELRISWTNPKDIDFSFIRIYRSTSPGVLGTVVHSTTTTSIIDRGLMPLTSYYYTVKSVDTMLRESTNEIQYVAMPIPPYQFQIEPISKICILGNKIVINLTVADGGGIDDVRLYYRKRGEPSYVYTLFSPAPVGQTLYSGKAEIHQDSVTVQGIEYYITASNRYRTIYWKSAASPQVVEVSNSFSSSILTGTLTVPDGNLEDGESKLEIPEGALREVKTITIIQKKPEDSPGRFGEYLGSEKPVAIYEISPNIVFDKPVTITLLYFDLDRNGIVDRTNIDETKLGIFHWDGFEWKLLGGSIVNKEKNTVSAKTFHIGLFGIFPIEGIPTGFRPREKIITPNNDGKNDTADFVGLSQPFTIKVFDITGTLVRKIEDVPSWDGKDNNGQRVENGLYIYQIHKDGKIISGTIAVAK